MIIYLGNAILVLYLENLRHITKIKWKNFIIYISFIHIYLLVALRAPLIGSDTLRYIDFFNHTKTISFFDFGYSRYMLGYELLNKILIPLENQQIFLAVLSFIPLFLIFRFIKDYSKIPWLSIFIFITFGFYAKSINLFRQYIAIGIVLVSYRYLITQNLLKFIITVLFAASFHISALVFLPVYFIKTWKINFKNLLLYLFIAIFIYLFSEDIIKLIITNFSTYSYSPEYRGGETLLIIYIFVYLSGLVFHKKVIHINYNSIILYNIIIFSIYIQILALDFSLFTRLTDYFSVFMIIFIPEVINSIKDNKIKFLGLYLIIILLFGFYIFSLKKDVHSITPYIGFWNK